MEAAKYLNIFTAEIALIIFPHTLSKNNIPGLT